MQAFVCFCRQMKSNEGVSLSIIWKLSHLRTETHQGIREWCAGYIETTDLSLNKTDRVTDWLTKWLTNCLTDRVTAWLTDWPSDWLSNCLTDRVTAWLTDQVTDWVTEWLTEWLTDRLTDQPTYGLTYQLDDWSKDHAYWLSVCLSVCLFSRDPRLVWHMTRQSLVSWLLAHCLYWPSNFLKHIRAPFPEFG